MQERILITGAGGQLGNVLLPALESKYGKEAILTTDLHRIEGISDKYFKLLDVTHHEALEQVISENKITQIYHLAALLSSSGEKNPELTWDVNFTAYLDVLRLSHRYGVQKVFFPSSIAIFGHTTPKVNTPQFSSFLPSTIYGIGKLSAEMWSQYYFDRYGLDVRSIRYPGVISWQSLPVGGTTDYSVEMFYAAVKGEDYVCYLRPDTYLPMMYIDDAVRGTLELMDAPREAILHSGYNLSAISFSPEELYESIKKHIPTFRVTYIPDQRQKIAESWSDSINDEYARKDWGWKPKYDLNKVTEVMLEKLDLKFRSNESNNN